VAVTELVLVTARDRADDGLDGPFVLPHRGMVREAADR
jgi:LysR family positive regulator for ilvC